MFYTIWTMSLGYLYSPIFKLWFSAYDKSIENDTKKEKLLIGKLVKRIWTAHKWSLHSMEWMFWNFKNNSKNHRSRNWYQWLYYTRPTIAPFFIEAVPGADACNFSEKETLTQAFYCEFCEIITNNFFHRTPPVAASVEISWKFRKSIKSYFINP